MLLKITSGIFRGSWWIFLLLLVLVAVYLLTGRFFAYYVTNNQDEIRAYLRQSGLQHIEIGSITGDWHIHDPALELKEVVLAPDGNPVLMIDRLNVRLNSFQSLFQRSPVVDQVEVVGLRFTLERDARGLKVRGLPRGEGSFDARYILDSVAHLESLSVSGIEIDLQEDGLELVFESIVGDPWLVREVDDVRQVTLPFIINRRLEGQSIRQHEIRVVGTYQGDPRRPDFNAELYLDVPRITITDYLPDIRLGNRFLTTAFLDTELWFQMGPDEVDLRTDFRLTDVQISTDAAPARLLDELRGQFRFHGESFRSGRMTIPDISITHVDRKLVLDSIDVAVDASEDQVIFAGRLPEVQVSRLMPIVDALGESGVVTERLMSTIKSIDPRGTLKDVSFYADLASGDAKLVGTVDDFSMGAYLGIPAITRLDGFVSLQPDRGYLDIDNDAFRMTFQNMFPESWPFDSGRGRVSYEVADNHVMVSSGLIELIHGDLEAYGKLAIKLPPDRDLQTWGLTIGIQRADLLEASRYIPLTVSTDLLEWLDSAILSGTSPLAGLNVHGALFRDAPPIRKSYDFYLNVKDTNLKYHPDWPAIEDVAATIHVDNYAVRSNNVSGRVYVTDIPRARVNVPINLDRKVDTVIVDAVATGPFSDGLKALRNTPLAEATSGMAAEWSGEGRLSTLLTLNVPMGDRSEEEVFADVRLEFSDALLDMRDYDLNVRGLTGSAGYRSDTGLQSSGFTGTVFEQPVRGSIATELKGDGGEIVVRVDGRVDAPDLYEWLDQVLLSRLAGMVSYEASIHVPFGGQEDRSYVVARSDLAGATVDLPYPLNKGEAETLRDFEFRQYFMEDGNRVEMSLGEQITASLKIQDGITTGGRIHLGGESAGVVTYDAVRMTGHLDYLDVESWMDTIDALNSLSEVSLATTAAEYMDSATLTFDELMVFSLPLENAEAVVTREEGAWRAKLTNRMLGGDVLVMDDDLQPLKIDLDYFRIEGEEGDDDPLGDVDPLGIQPVDFSVRQLLLDGEDFGNWSFRFRSDGQKARFEDLTATAAGVKVKPGSVVEWMPVEDGFKSSFTGSLVVANLSDALTKFGFASSVEGSDLNLAASVSWPGSPAMVDVDTMVGDVSILKGKGRFVQAETGGALKLLGVFDFASLARRFRLDFSDVINSGFEFQDVKGVAHFNRGVISVREPILISGSSGNFKVGGTVDMNTRNLDNDMIVTLPVSKTLPWYAAYSAIATGPLAGAGVMLAQRVFRNQINQMSSAKYRVSGTIEEPFIEFVSIFNDTVRESEAGSE